MDDLQSSEESAFVNDDVQNIVKDSIESCLQQVTWNSNKVGLDSDAPQNRAAVEASIARVHVPPTMEGRRLLVFTRHRAGWAMDFEHYRAIHEALDCPEQAVQVYRHRRDHAAQRCRFPLRQVCLRARTASGAASGAAPWNVPGTMPFNAPITVIGTVPTIPPGTLPPKTCGA